MRERDDARFEAVMRMKNEPLVLLRKIERMAWERYRDEVLDA